LIKSIALLYEAQGKNSIIAPFCQAAIKADERVVFVGLLPLTRCVA
jgi:hypothetical protein